MRILHTSDWHLGRVTYKVPREADHDAVLAEIVRIAAEEKPDLVIHSGDLFDHRRPSYRDQRRAVRVLHQLAEVAPVVVICGNHDSPELFDLLAEWFWPNDRIRFIGTPRGPADGGVLRYTGADSVVLRLAVLPFVHINRVVEAFEDASSLRLRYAERIAGFQETLAEELFRELDPEREVTAFAGHQYISGVDFPGHVHTPLMRERYATDPDQIPAVGYAAFGDIHKPQKIPGSKVVGRYAGSPLQLDFGEAGEQKSLVVVDLHPGREADVRLVPLTAGRTLWRFDGTLDELRAVAPAVGDQLCLLKVRTPTPDPTLSEQVHALLPEARILDIDENPDDRRLEPLVEEAGAADDEPTLSELFVDYLEGVSTSRAPAKDLPPLFDALLTAEDDATIPEVTKIEALLIKPLAEPVAEKEVTS
jgi:exonuclease SbcD